MRGGSAFAATLLLIARTPLGAEPQASARTQPTPVDAATAEILRKAAEYVDGCEQTFRHIVAEELYAQWGPDPGTSAIARRTLRSDLVFVSLPGEIPWTTFRDVYEVDGRAVREREARLERLFMRPSRDALAQADRILREGARYNLGEAFRTVNVPTLALLFLHARNQPRFSFARKGRRLFDGISGVEVAFDEAARPTIVRNSYGGDVPVKGRAWIDPTRGTVLRIEADYDLTTERDRAQNKRQTAYVSTAFEREPALDAHVPVEMKELYLTGAGRIEATARYSNFRRFLVETEERLEGIGSPRSAPDKPAPPD
jgi:hypothetical protein